MRGFAVAATLLLSSAMVVVAGTPQERLQESTDVFRQIMRSPDKGIPQDLLNDAHCVIIVPNMKKGAFIVGGEYGRGFATCRQPRGKGWTAPAAVRMEGGSIGFQLGGTSTDVIMLVMNQHGMKKLMQDKFTIGADASAAAGPVGRTARAATNVRLDAEILSYSRSKGLFAGVSLNGATLRPDKDENRELYGSDVTNKEILTGKVRPTAAAKPLLSELQRYSPRESTSTK